MKSLLRGEEESPKQIFKIIKENNRKRRNNWLRGFNPRNGFVTLIQSTLLNKCKTYNAQNTLVVLEHNTWK